MADARPDDVPDAIVALREQLTELDTLVNGLGDGDLAAPSACPEWDVSDVLAHLAHSNEVATASAEGRWQEVGGAWSAVTDGDTVNQVVDVAMHEAKRGMSAADVVRWWRASADDMAAAFEAVDPDARVQWIVGDMAARTLATTRLAETWIHLTDITAGLDVEVAPTTRLWHIARLAHRTIPYAFELDRRGPPGPVRFELSPPTGDSSVWAFGEPGARTVVIGPAVELCLVAGQRLDATDSDLEATGEDGDAVLEVVRTFA